MITVLLSSMISQAEKDETRSYMNLAFTVWHLEYGLSEAAQKVSAPIPQVFKESWINDFIHFDLSRKKPETKVIEKESIRFVITAEQDQSLTIRVIEEGKDRFIFTHSRPSTANYLFYGLDGRTHFIKACYSIDNHPIGLLSPGIRKK